MTDPRTTELGQTGQDQTGQDQTGRGPTDAPREDNETTLAAGVPGPSGTGEKTTAGADPDAPTGQPA